MLHILLLSLCPSLSVVSLVNCSTIRYARESLAFFLRSRRGEQ